MKKALLALAAVLGMGFAANADVATLTTDGYINAQEVGTVTLNNGDIILAFTKGNNNNNTKYYTSGSAFRMYGANVLTATCAEGFEITSIKFTMSSSNGTWREGFSVDPGTFSDNTWAGNATKVTITNGTVASGQTRFTKIEVTYASTVAAAVETPEISLVEGAEGFTANITCATEGADIYYTTDGMEPTATSTKFENAFDVWGKTTIKAIAIKGEDQSRVATFEANPPMIFTDFTNLSSLEIVDNQKVPVIVKGAPITVIYRNGDNLYANCGWGSNMLIYQSKATWTYNPGDTFYRLEGNYTLSNGQPEITDAVFGEVESGMPVQPQFNELAYINDGSINGYYALEGVNIITKTSGKNATLTDAEGNELALYNKFGLENFADATDLRVVGFVGKDTRQELSLQFYPTEITAMETVATPVITPEAGDFDIDTQKVTIACETEGADIYYTLDGTDPDQYMSRWYSEPFALTMPENSTELTVKAIAVVEGMLPSEIATVTYKLVSGVEDVMVGVDAAVEYFNLQGVRVAQPTPGLYIRRCGDKVEKVTVK